MLMQSPSTAERHPRVSQQIMFLELQSTESQTHHFACGEFVWLSHVSGWFWCPLWLHWEFLDFCRVGSGDTLTLVGTLQRRQVVRSIRLLAAAASCAHGSCSESREPMVWVQMQWSRNRHVLVFSKLTCAPDNRHQGP